MVTASNYVYRVPTKLFSLSSLYWCSLKPATNDTGLSSQVFHVQQKKIHSSNSNKIYKLTHELGSIPLCQWAWSAPGPQSLPGHPELPQTILRNKLIYKFTKDYATPKIPGLGRNPFWLLEQSHVQSVSRYGRPEPYKQTLHNRSSAPPLVKGTTCPQTP